MIAMVVMMAVVRIITTKVIWIGIVVIGVRVWVIIWFRIEWPFCLCIISFLHRRTMAFRVPGNSILNKSNLTDRPRATKMIFPCFKCYPAGSLITNKVCSPPRRDHFFFGHVRPNIRNTTGVA
jgi:hypothetical protein